MKKRSIVLSVLLLIGLGSAEVFANIDNLSNMSVEWMRTCNRNAATDSTDIVVYNPAGLTSLSDGIHISLGNQTMLRSPEHSFDMGLGAGKKSFEQDTPDWFLPNFYAAYKQKNWAVFGGIYIPGGGAVADYPDGSVTTQFIGAMTVLSSSGALTGFRNDNLEASSMYLTSTLGGAYAINDKISLALGVRYISAKNETKAGATFTDAFGGTHNFQLDYEDTADGFGGIFGLELFPMKNLNIGIRYESRVPLEFETELNRNDFPAEFELADYKAKNRRDFPATLGMGAAYMIRPGLTAELDFSWYFQKQANWGKSASGKDVSDLAGDCYSMGAALSYQMTPELLVSGGLIFTKFLFDDMDAYYETMGAFEVLYSDNWNLGAGCAYEVTDGIKLNFALGWTIWESETITYNNAAAAGLEPFEVDTENSTITFSLGVDIAY